MSGLRTGRRNYYDRFSHFYDAFIRLHARKERNTTRKFLVRAAHLERKSKPRVLDICCGTGDVILSFAAESSDGLWVGYDFSHRMLLKASEKDQSARVRFLEGDAAELPFPDGIFDVCCCSHALYELKRNARRMALGEMYRVVRDDGLVLIMEHEMPSHPLVRMMFYLRLLSMGAEDAEEFIRSGTEPFEAVFSRVGLTHSPSGRSKLLICRK